jgi:hypothetical protein
VGRVVLVVGTILIMAGCNHAPVGPADKGIDYTFTNRCNEVIVVELGTGGRAITLNVDERYTIHTLDRQPDAAFVVLRADGTGKVRFTPGLPTFEIVGERCPQV